MKGFISAAVAIFALGAASYSVASTFIDQTHTVSSEIVEHGGGCRDSSPPGQCCHMDHSTGIVHCH